MGLMAVSEGTIWKSEPGTRLPSCSGPRCVTLNSGRILCTFMVQSSMGVNDFVPMAVLSPDGGVSWSAARPVWPDLESRLSLFCSVSRSPSGGLFLFGIRTVIDVPGESFWNEATQGMKQNELFWARSMDEGTSWSEPQVIPMPIPGAAEAPGPMCVTRDGRWIACYSPYNTFDPKLAVARQQVVAISSDDQGESWTHTSMLRFTEDQSGGAEAWVVELADGQLFGAAWHTSFREGIEYQNAYSLSVNGGRTWCPTRPTGILGQAVGLAALPGGDALFIYNQRKHRPIGVWLARISPNEKKFGVHWNQGIWLAEEATRTGGSADHLNWTDFAFGEPSITPLPDGTWLAAFWHSTSYGGEIRYIKLKEDNSVAK
jgi:BNR repeat-like domain